MGKAVIRFLSSVKLAIVLIILLVAASVVGTLIPQGRDMAEYAVRYGRMGAPLVKLQLTSIFRSVWFLGVLGLFGLNIAACTLTRIGGKMRRARRPRIESDPKAQAVAAGTIRDEVRWKGRAAGRAATYAAGSKDGKDRKEKERPGPEGFEEAVRAAEGALRASRYKVRIARKDGDAEKAGGLRAGADILGRKRIDGIFGSDFVHLGLLVIIAGGIITAAGGFRTDLVLGEGAVVEVPKADFGVRLDRFETETYADGSVKDWKSTLAVIENGREARSQVVEVNHPLVYGGFSFYQSAYGYDWDAATLELWIGKSGEAGGTGGYGGAAGADKGSAEDATGLIIKVRVGAKAALGDAEGTEILVRRFLPDFVIGENGVPETRSDQPNNPAALIDVRQGGNKVFGGWIFAAYPEFGRSHGAAGAGRTGEGRGAAGATGENTAPKLRIELRDFNMPQYSVIQAARDPGVPFIWLGCLLVMAGLVLAFYRPTWEIRMAVEESADGKIMVRAGGNAAKSRDRFAADFARVMSRLKNWYQVNHSPISGI